MTGIDNPAAMGGSALFATLAIQALKNSGWATWFNRETARANLGLSIAIAGAASLGIHFVWDAAKDTLTITGLAFSLRHSVWEWALQWAAQHAAYKGFVVPSETLGEIRALLQRSLPPSITTAESKGKD